MKKILLSSLACASLALASNSDYKYEITPLLGGALHEGGTGIEKNYGNLGLALGLNQEDSFIDQIELGLLRSVTKIDGKNENAGKSKNGITRFFVNGVKDFGLTNDLSFYTLAGLGYQMFDKQWGGHEDDSAFGNYGFGLKYNLTDSLALKFDLRHLMDIGNGTPDNTLLYNFGLAIPFGEKAPKVIAVEPAPAPAPAPKQVVAPVKPINLDVHFDTAKAVIKNTYNPKLNEFADMMKANKNFTADIEGHTDSVGSVAYNQKLSERRAAAAVDALTNLGVDKNRLRAVGYGKSRPIASNDTPEGRAENRRVHAVMTNK
ncbi:OmpA family protein [Aliarcobacter cryaerophilus]|uniref:OmpA family protein n=1 Tax=Aliarcobacter cryaerophilus TaxID=28198 RepID=UPI0008256C03|nr:OmpA family protein [Aliarcobacter cryaerophilus]